MKMTAETVFRDSELLCEETTQGVETGNKLSRLALYTVAGSSLYGLTMGLYHSLLQGLVSAVKVPLLFLLTLFICLPTLHFIGLLFGSALRLGQSLVVLLAGLALTSVLLGAFAPISLLFLVSGSDYEWLLLMHVAVFAFCGAAGLASIHRNYRAVRLRAGGETANSDAVLKVWMVLYMLVGTQTAYVLAPFIEREPTFKLFHGGRGNFYSYVWSVIDEALRQPRLGP